MQVLVTGAAGFIGFHLCQSLLARGDSVVGIDNLNDYYDVQLKQDRLKIIQNHPGFSFEKFDLCDQAGINQLFKNNSFDVVVNLAAQAGVRYSLTNPHVYIDSNITGFLNILEACRHHSIKNLVFASSSSVYGANTRQPFSVHDSVNHPLSLYAASKKANELMAHTYANLFEVPCTALRFFTVYGPWGRPDMALFMFTKNILEDNPIDVFNEGHMLRDFTYVDDIVKGITCVVDHPAAPNPNWHGDHPDPASSFAPYRIYNIGNGSPVKLTDFIEAIEDATGKKAIRNLMPLQPGDVPATYADTSELANDFGFKPYTPIREGVNAFVKWYRDYYKV